MEKDFWALFSITLLGSIVLFSMIVVCIFKCKRFFQKKHGVLLFTGCLIILTVFWGLTLNHSIPCWKDLGYVLKGTYLEERAKVTAFTYSEHDLDGNGEIAYSKPKFHLVDKNTYVVLYAKDVEIGKTYLIRYYPSTKICEVIKEIP